MGLGGIYVGGGYQCGPKGSWSPLIGSLKTKGGLSHPKELGGKHWQADTRRRGSHESLQWSHVPGVSGAEHNLKMTHKKKLWEEMGLKRGQRQITVP